MSTSIYRKFRTDANLEAQEGVELNYGDGMKIKIHRAGGENKNYAKSLRAKLANNRRALDETMDEATARKNLAEIYAESIIIGWEGISDEDGKPLEFTRANCIKVLCDLPELFRDIQDASNNAALFRRAEQDADRKNS